jgi:hypothetical protein
MHGTLRAPHQAAGTHHHQKRAHINHGQDHHAEPQHYSGDAATNQAEAAHDVDGQDRHRDPDLEQLDEQLEPNDVTRPVSSKTSPS